MKKAQGISINVIIIAAIALLVLVILAVLVIRGGTNINTKTQKCEVVGGTCKNDCGTATAIEGECAENGQECCPIFSTG